MKKSLLFISLILSVVFVFSACEYSVSTASIGETKLCAQPNDNGECLEGATTFTAGTRTLHATTALNYAPSDTTVRSEWWQTSPSAKIAEASVTTKDNENVLFFSVDTEGFPAGQYEFKVYLNNVAEPQVTPFTVQ